MIENRLKGTKLDGKTPEESTRSQVVSLTMEALGGIERMDMHTGYLEKNLMFLF